MPTLGKPENNLRAAGAGAAAAAAAAAVVVVSVVVVDVNSIFIVTISTARMTKNTDWSTGPLTRPFARLLAHSLAPLTRSRTPLQ